MNKLVLQLYVNGDGLASMDTIESLTAICQERLLGEYALEIVDIQRDPDRAETAGILAIPTLVRSWPLPITRLIGALTVKSRVLAGLGLPALTPAA